MTYWDMLVLGREKVSTSHLLLGRRRWIPNSYHTSTAAISQATRARQSLTPSPSITIQTQSPPSRHPNTSIPLENVFEASHPNNTPQATDHTPPTAPSTPSNITTSPQSLLHTPLSLLTLSLLTLSLIALTNFLLTAYFNPTITENRFWPLNPLLTLLTQIEDLLFDTVGYVIFMTVFTVWLALVEFAEWNGACWLIERVIDEDDDDGDGEGEEGGWGRGDVVM
jgi:hypothetical protein